MAFTDKLDDQTTGKTYGISNHGGEWSIMKDDPPTSDLMELLNRLGSISAMLKDNANTLRHYSNKLQTYPGDDIKMQEEPVVEIDTFISRLQSVYNELRDTNNLLCVTNESFNRSIGQD